MICNIVLNHWLLRQGSDLSPSFSSDVFGMLHNKLMTTWYAVIPLLPPMGDVLITVNPLTGMEPNMLTTC